MKITVKELKKLGACADGIAWLKTQKNKEAKAILRKCVNDGKFSYANWYVTQLFTKPQCVMYAIYSAELSLNIFETQRPNDNRPRKAIEVAKKYLSDPTEESRSAASAAAWSDACSAACAAACAAAAWSDARSAASAAACAAACAAASAACAAASAAWSGESAAESARSKIIEKAIEILGL